MANDTSPEPGDEQQTRIELVTQEPMVDWLDPMQLLQTAMRALTAGNFGSFADGRNVQAALHPPAANPPIDFSGDDQAALWIDYLADTGDGWDSTYSVAYAVSRDTLVVPGLDAPLPRGKLLMMGGDQVYPTPAQAGYRTRLLDPFRSAFPAAIPPSNSADDPTLVAIPGNHDWYDGLHDFVQLFCSGDYIGRWKTRQHTSYYAVKLPHGWWLWGVDLQLDSGIDTPQYEYFRNIASTQLQAGDRVILNPPEPSWIDESERLCRSRDVSLTEIETQSPRFRALQSIEDLIATQSGNKAQLSFVVAGDLHLYSRWVPAQESAAQTPQRITCGGGGAYAHGTHGLPTGLKFKVGRAEQIYQRGATFPDDATSKQLRNGAWRLPTRNVGFCVLLGLVYLLFAWLLQSASKLSNAMLGDVSVMEYLANPAFSLSDALCALPRALYGAMSNSPGALFLLALIVVGAGAFTASSATVRKQRAWIGGFLHGVLHVSLALLLLLGAARLNLNVLGPCLGHPVAHTFVDHPVQVLLFLLETGVLGGILGGLLFGSWMVFANALFGWHSDEVFSSQGIADYKSFLKMRIDANGLTIYPLKITRVCRTWKLGRGVEMLLRAGQTWRLRATRGSGARFEPDTPLVVELIEPPIHLPAQTKGKA
jgi:hypothetical protein